jgi:preprotein translocase subunit SecE
VTRLRRFIEEAWSELKKVTWPTREHTRNLTVLVFVVSAAVGAYIAVFDFLFTQAVAILTGLLGTFGA